LSEILKLPAAQLELIIRSTPFKITFFIVLNTVFLFFVLCQELQTTVDRPLQLANPWIKISSAMSSQATPFNAIDRQVNSFPRHPLHSLTHGLTTFNVVAMDQRRKDALKGYKEVGLLILFAF
jgi:hypothetical protein